MVYEMEAGARRFAKLFVHIPKSLSGVTESLCFCQFLQAIEFCGSVLLPDSDEDVIFEVFPCPSVETSEKISGLGHAFCGFNHDRFAKRILDSKAHLLPFSRIQSMILFGATALSDLAISTTCFARNESRELEWERMERTTPRVSGSNSLGSGARFSLIAINPSSCIPARCIRYIFGLRPERVPTKSIRSSFSS